MGVRQYRKEAAARARLARQAKEKSTEVAENQENNVQSPNNHISEPTDTVVIEILDESDSDFDVKYLGGVDTVLSSDYERLTTACEDAPSSGPGFESMSELDEEDFQVFNIKIGKKTLYSQLELTKSTREWKKIEAKRSLGYDGHSKRTQRLYEQKARARAKQREEAKNSNQKDVALMHNFFTIKSPAQSRSRHTSTGCDIQTTTDLHANVQASDWGVFAEMVNYASDEDSGSSGDDADDEDFEEEACTIHHVSTDTSQSQPRLPAVPAVKRTRHPIPIRKARELRAQKRNDEYKEALEAIQKKIKSKKTEFAAGPNGLQARRARAISSYLHMIVNGQRNEMDASERAAESHGFAPKWGGRNLRSWTKTWVKKRELPTSKRGTHNKVFSLLDNPVIRAELRAFVRSHRWSMNPAKLQAFSQGTMLPEAAEQYLRQVVRTEIPSGLKRYMEVELFPRMQVKVAKGISLSTARRWLKGEGFRYIQYNKGLYFDGHDRPDVVEYRQKVFLPAMKEYMPRLVRYAVGNVAKELPLDGVERPLVLVAQDEMTAQAHDTKSKSWVLNGQHALRKKGPGRGLHQSDVICSTVGWLKDASQTLEYGKSYDGYWTGELFVKQLQEKIIPAFEAAHPPGYQALIMVDNSQGHSAYAEDALIASRMNVKPGGAQARMRNGWYMKDGKKFVQPLIYPSTDPTFPNQPKGMRAVLEERGIDTTGTCGRCKKCEPGITYCCLRRIIENQPDFKAQKSLVQEVIERAGHLCILLPKFHCELNFIEFFWGVVKRYLRERCDMTFDTLKTNMPLAMESVPLETIRKWEHRMHRWMEAYREDLGTQEAQIKVKAFSSTKYKSHRRVPEAVAASFDA